MNQKVSVVIPLFNHEKYITNALRSVQNQTISVFEIIVIDDGSKDGSGDIVKKIAKSDDRIKYFYQKNSGAHNAINIGIKKASGDYIAILNSDDIFKEDKIERCLKIVNNSDDVEVVFGGVDFIDSAGKKIECGVPIDWQLRGKDFIDKNDLFLLSMLNENIISTTSNMFFKKRLISDKIKFYPLRYCHDLDFIVSCVKDYKTYYDRENVHISYRYHEANTLKENINDIRLEVAAVISVALVDFGTKIIDEREKNIKYIAELLRNKGFANAIVYLMMVYLEKSEKNDFYEYVYDKENKRKLYTLLS